MNAWEEHVCDNMLIVRKWLCADLTADDEREKAVALEIEKFRKRQAIRDK